MGRAAVTRLPRRLGRRGFREVLQRTLPIRGRADLEKLGSEYGGWHVPMSLVRPGWVCYCAGVGEDATFDFALAGRLGCDVHAFDPTPRSIAYAESAHAPPGFSFHPVGVWWREETLRFYAPHNPEFVSHSVKKLWHSNEYFEARCRSVAQLMSDLGHDRVDLLKLDIEGAETEVIGHCLDEGILPQVLCVEFDQPIRILRTVRSLSRAGYDLVHIERWNYTFVLRPRNRRGGHSWT